MTRIYAIGDLAIPELLITLFGVPLTITAFIIFLLLIFTRNKSKPRLVIKPLQVICLVSFTVVLVSVLVISMRNFGEWRELKKALIFQSKRVEALVPNRDRMLTYEEFKNIEGELFKEPVLFTADSLEKPITIRMMTTIPPYVGVDFGNGANNVFDLKTMVVTYGD